MKILVLTPWYPNPENKTAGIFVKEQCFAIAKKAEHDVVVISPFASNRFSNIIRNEIRLKKSLLTEVLVPYKPEKTLVDKYLKRKQSIKRALKKVKFDPDIFHVHEYQMVPIAKSLISNLPIVLTEHSSMLPYNLGIKKYMARKAFRIAKTVIAVSEYQKKRILSIENSANVRVVNNFVDDIFLFFRKKKADKGTKIRIISVGNLVEKKGFSLLIRAMSKLEKEFELIIVGSGPQLHELRILVKELKLSDRVFFTGSLSKEAVSQKLRESDIFVSASKIETFGIAILEALAVGLPVVTYRNGGEEDFMRDFCGIVVEDYTPQAFAKAIKELGENIKRYDADLIQKYVKENFSSSIFARKINLIYEETNKL